MLPPSQFGGNRGQGYDDISNQDVFGSKARYDIIRGGIEQWDKGGSGFDTDTWLESMTDIKNYVISIDDNGDVHVDFDFDFEYDGEYAGTRHVSYSY